MTIDAQQPKPQPEHCEHECVCPDWGASHSDEDEDPEPCTISCMQRMTRPHIPAPEIVWRCCEFLPRSMDRKPEDCEMVKEAARTATLPLKPTYEKFKHLDVCLSDPEWCESMDSAPIYGIAGEMWRAIKESLKGVP